MTSPGLEIADARLASPSFEPSVTTDLRLRIDGNAESALVIAGERAPQALDPARFGIAVGARILHRLGQLVDDVRRRREVRVAHAEVDDVLADGAGAGLHGVDLGEDVRRQPPDLEEFLVHHVVTRANTKSGVSADADAASAHRLPRFSPPFVAAPNTCRSPSRVAMGARDRAT